MCTYCVFNSDNIKRIKKIVNNKRRKFLDYVLCSYLLKVDTGTYNTFVSYYVYCIRRAHCEIK